MQLKKIHVKYEAIYANPILLKP